MLVVAVVVVAAVGPARGPEEADTVRKERVGGGELAMAGTLRPLDSEGAREAVDDSGGAEDL